jgi:putative heme-binding domain-containing protein
MLKMPVTTRTALAVVAAVMLGLPLKSQQAGQQLFGSMCAGCHGLDARGGEHAPNIATAPDVQGMSDSELLDVIRNGIPAAGMPAFGSSLKGDQVEAVVSYLRILQGKTKLAVLAGKPDAGRALFFGKARCSECHMIAGKGGFIAADLSNYGSEHSAAAIRKAIVDPDANLDPRERTATVVMRDGRKFSGIARNEDNFSVQLQTTDGTFRLFDKSKIASFEYRRRSLMPDGYASMLSARELNDLVSYLVKAAESEGGGPPDADEF